MSELRRWSGHPPVITASIAWCPDCGAPVIDRPDRWEEHNRRVHSQGPLLERLTSTALAPPRPRGSRGPISEESAILCPACRIHNCLCCDGGRCRCVCAIELDEPRRRVRPGL